MKVSLCDRLISTGLILTSISGGFSQEKPSIEEFPYPRYENLLVIAEWLQTDLRQNSM